MTTRYEKAWPAVTGPPCQSPTSSSGRALNSTTRGVRTGKTGCCPAPYHSRVAAQWSMSDAWVFSSIEGTSSDDGYTLAQIIAKADGINHAILTENEFVRAVPRLVAAGLVGALADADRYWHTETGQALRGRWVKRGGLFGWMDVIPPALRRLGEPQDAAWSLPAGAFERAVQAHLQWGEAALKRHRRRDPGERP